MSPGHFHWKTLTLVFVTYVMAVTLGKRGCRDRGSWCSKIGKQFPLSRCYEKERRCCNTCTKLRLTIPGCPYGGREAWCDEIGYGRPISLCYTHNDTCCETCHLYDSGIAECPYGDMLSWCGDIGTRYTINSCYENKEKCCDTCGRLNSGDADCPYGDNAAWCGLIGTTISDNLCKTSTECCETCGKLFKTTAAMKNITTTTESKLVSSLLTTLPSTVTQHSSRGQGHMGSHTNSSIYSSTAKLALSTKATPIDTNHVPQKDGVVTPTLTLTHSVGVTSHTPTYHPAAPSTTTPHSDVIISDNVTSVSNISEYTVPNSYYNNNKTLEDSGKDITKSTVKLDLKPDPGSVSGERSQENITLDKTPAKNSTVTDKTQSEKTKDGGWEFSHVKDDRDRQAAVAPGSGSSSGPPPHVNLPLLASIYVTLRLLTC